METIGSRIKRLRERQSWSRPELGRRMAKGAGRKTPYSGELIRLYESDVNEPGNDARKALAKVFDKSEAYIEFGSTGDAPSNDTMLGQLVDFYHALSDDGKHALLGHANRLYSQENPGASVANPYPGAKQPHKPLVQGNIVGASRHDAYSGKARRKS